MTSFFPLVNDASSSQYTDLYHFPLPDFWAGDLEGTGDLYSHRLKDFKDVLLLSELMAFWNCHPPLEISSLQRGLESKGRTGDLIQKMEVSGATHLTPTKYLPPTHTSIVCIFKSSLFVFISLLLNLLIWRSIIVKNFLFNFDIFHFIPITCL